MLLSPIISYKIDRYYYVLIIKYYFIFVYLFYILIIYKIPLYTNFKKHGIQRVGQPYL